VREPQMSTIHLRQATTLTAEQYIAGLSDFGPSLSKFFVSSADEYRTAHNLGPLKAGVTEGPRGILECLHCNWSDPNRVVLRTSDPDVWGGASGHTYTVARRPKRLRKFHRGYLYPEWHLESPRADRRITVRHRDGLHDCDVASAGLGRLARH
jgi:hypothetical protein